jgi:uncharacterized protein YcfL
MKKVILVLLVAILVSCHSSSVKLEVNEDSILTKYSIDTIAGINDSLLVDSLKVDTLK